MLLNRQELCEACGVSDSSITAWEKKGMPVVRKGRGRGQKSIYNYDQVKDWCARTGLGSSIQALMARVRASAETVAPPRGPAAQRPSLPINGREIATAIAIARVNCLDDLPGWELEAAPADLAEAIALYIRALADALASVGIEGVTQIIDQCASESAWPGDWAAIVDRARQEIPQGELNG